MRIIHLSSYDVAGGSALAAHRLHHGLREAGDNSRMIVRRRFGAGDGVEEFGGWIEQFCARIRRRRELWIARRHRWLRTARFSTGLTGASLAAAIRRMDCDVVHFHWVNDGFVDITEMGAFARPIVWTLHDMWPFTGGCHYAGECRRFEEQCGACPLLGAGDETDLSRFVWCKKNEAYARARIMIVAPSRWLARHAGRSSLLGDREIRCVPYGLSADWFKNRDQAAARARLGLPLNRPVIVSGAVRFRADPRKGFDLFCEIARRLAAVSRTRPIYAVFGTDPAGSVRMNDLDLVELGVVADERRMADIYAGADVFVAPSREDNLPNTLVEAQACGTPGAAFAIGGIPEIIEDGVTGCLATPFDAEELARRIHVLITDDKRLSATRQAARSRARTEYSMDTMVQRYRAIYAEVSARR